MEVSPSKQNINELFATTSFYIDFYQREYKWGKETVEKLLDDLFYTFDRDYEQHQTLDPGPEVIAAQYHWYYLNTYITNKTEGKIFIVDGQQRLTTISLMLIALYHLCRKFESIGLQRWIETKLVGIGMGGTRRYWLDHDKRQAIMHSLLENGCAEDAICQTTTTRNMADNYAAICEYLELRISSKHRLDTFVYFFLCMVVIVYLDVPIVDVPMVFEVINDRGVRLRPYEILKGKLLGTLEKSEVNSYADVWDKSLASLERNGTKEIDEFFKTFLKSQFATSKKTGQLFDGSYHRTIFDDRAAAKFSLSEGATAVKSFLKGPFSYYARLYERLDCLSVGQDSACPELFYSSQLNRMDGHVMLTMAACDVSDPQESAKIKAVGRAYDKAYVMLQLNRAYDSNEFQDLLYSLQVKLRTASVDAIGQVIDEAVLNVINRRRGTELNQLLPYTQFKQAGYGDFNPTFLRYLLTRIEVFLAEGLSRQLQDTLHNFVRGTGKTNSYHVEHILARNKESRDLFVKNGSFNEESFEAERNRLGGLLLLKGRDNQSSGNETYGKKLKSYSGSAPLLAQTLVPDFYKANSAMKEFKLASGLAFQPFEHFDLNALEKRSALMYSLIDRIWRC